jgi:3'-5' exoribonuclease
MPRIAISQLHDGDYLDQSFILSDKQLGTTSTNKIYIKADCGDATGRINLRLWNAPRDMYDKLPTSGYVHVKGRVENYQGHLQLVADSIVPITDYSKIDISELIRSTQRSVPQMFARVKEILATVRDADLKALLQCYLDDAELMKLFTIAPAAAAMHHAWIGGLLEHTHDLLELATLICPRYADIDQDLVLTGLFLHDLAKTRELTYTVGFDYSDAGKLVGHIVMGVVWLNQKAATLATQRGTPIRKELLTVLEHILLSHHGVPEFGSPIVPKTPEAILINLIDNLDAKTRMALDAVNAPCEDSTWTEYQRAFETKLYRPTVTQG